MTAPVQQRPYGYFVFTREVSERYVHRDQVAELAKAMGAPEWACPEQPDDRTIFSRIVKDAHNGLRPKKMDLRKVKSTPTRMEYALLGAGKPAGPGAKQAMTQLGTVMWTPDLGLTFSDLAEDDTFRVAFTEKFTMAQQLVGREDWMKVLREGFTYHWGGFAARKGGVIYWICPGPAGMPEVALVRSLLLTATGLDILAAPCLDPSVAQELLVAGATDEGVTIQKLKAKADKKAAAMVTLHGKVCNAISVLGLDAEGLPANVKAVLAKIEEEIGAEPTVPEELTETPLPPALPATPPPVEPVKATTVGEAMKSGMPTPPPPPPPVQSNVPVVSVHVYSIKGKQYTVRPVDSVRGMQVFKAVNAENLFPDFDWEEGPESGFWWTAFEGAIFIQPME